MATRAARPSFLQFLVVLTRVDPLVWRRIQVPSTYSFWDLHVAIQDAMGWQDSHLHEFNVAAPTGGGIRRIGIPDPDETEDGDVEEGRTVPIATITEGDWSALHLPMRYAYDFGDGWEHIVTLEAQGLAETRAKYPCCVAGANRCPPEDCGGPEGYAALVEAIASRKPSAEARELLAWAGGAFDPREFDPAKVRFDDPKKRWKRAFGP